MSISVSILDIWLNIFQKGGILNKTDILDMFVGDITVELKYRNALNQPRHVDIFLKLGKLLR